MLAPLIDFMSTMLHSKIKVNFVLTSQTVAFFPQFVEVRRNSSLKMNFGVQEIDVW